MKTLAFKKIFNLYFFMFSFFSMVCFAQQRVPISDLTEKDNQLMFNGKPFTGIAFQLATDGTVTQEFVCKDGKPDGMEKQFVNGKLTKEIEYKDGKRTGNKKYYFENGKLHMEIKYDNNINEGSRKYFYENGQLSEEVKLKNHNPYGVEKRYNKEGKLLEEMTWINGEVVSNNVNDQNGNEIQGEKGFGGYWIKNGVTYSKALHISKNQNLYNIEQIISDGSLKTTNNLTISNNRLETNWGSFEYVSGNDILLDRSVSNGTTFTRITKEVWDKNVRTHQ